MENVPQLASDVEYREHVNSIRNSGYSVESMKIKYSDYGSASGRTRLITVGFKDPELEAARFFDKLSERKALASTVGQAINKYEKMEKGGYPDHDHPCLQLTGFTSAFSRLLASWRRNDLADEY